MPYALALAVAVGVTLGLLGAGGSILTVPILIGFAHVGPKSAVISSLVVVGATSFSACLQHWLKGRVRTGIALMFAATGMQGALVGAWVSRPLTPRTVQLIFAAVMVVSALGMLFRRERPSSEKREQRPGLALLVGFFVGIITGVVGAGGGFLIVPALVLLAAVPMQDAVGTSLLTITLNCIAGLVAKWGSAPLDWQLTFAFTGCAIGGSVVGLQLARRVSAASLRRAFALLIVAIAGWMALGN